MKIISRSDKPSKMHLFWPTKSFSSKFLSCSTIVFDDARYIRDQFDHSLCWDFTLCDSISATAVLRG